MVESPTPTRRPVAIDLFAGAGGLSLGFEMAGFDVLSAVEYDPVHAATHLYNFPLTDVLCRDVRTVSAAELIESTRRGWTAHNPNSGEWDGIVDVLIGGPSCQGFSVMGRQDIDDDRNQLIGEFVRLVEAIRPRAFCMENVPGFLHTRFDGLRNEALDRLRAAGYSISGQQKPLLATDFGVPQKRKRVFIMGALTGEAPTIPKAKTAPAATVANAFEGLPDLENYATAGESDVILLTTTDQARLESVNDYLAFAGTAGRGNERYGHRRNIDKSSLSGCKKTSHRPESILRFSETAQGTTEKISRAYRLSENRASNTLRAGTGRERGAFSASRPLHPTVPRVITVREAARLHSFPDWFRFHTTNWHGHRQIGNAVPPLLAVAAAESILSALDLKPQKSENAAIDFGDESLLSLNPTTAAVILSAISSQVPRQRQREVAVLTLPIAIADGEDAA